MGAFTAEVYQNEYLPAGGTDVHAVITVTSTGRPDGPDGLADPTTTYGSPSPEGSPPPDGSPSLDGSRRPELAEVLLLDCSGSMANPPEKIAQARHATCAALDCVPDDVWFAIVRGTGAASMIYPDSPRLVAASPATREQARLAVERVEPHGGTAIGRWLDLARALMATRPRAIAHALLLTDGQNGELARDLAAAVAACRGRFQCDCRGIGTDWRIDELRLIATSLLGTVDAIGSPDELVADFTSVIATATSRTTDRVALRVWTPRGAEVGFLREVSPMLRDLRAEAATSDDHSVDYPTGAWGTESRDYHLNIRVQARPVGTEALAARVSLVIDGRETSQALVRAMWTDDETRSAPVSAAVAHYTGQAELAASVLHGLEARQSGDEATATLLLGRGAQLALASGNEDTYRLLQKVVHIDNATTGTVRLKKNVKKIDEMVLDTRSTRTLRVNR
ncbi:VWA domain-containing protein [Frankia sp. QA3]|uniref:vWA domain-containing protein n=1 Tax=Frankia sp. QA3 TaxID=710111 RepID=UPI000269CB7D|nr:VWA domain-containing protein [Frankia sp. QA3]EIV95390.1 hypothetical protein FraQA3DRAFT_5203 [Frankia sp. QA3]